MEKTLMLDPTSQIPVVPNHHLDVVETVDDYLRQNGWKAQANSNSNYSFSGLVMHTAGAVVANYALGKIYTAPIRRAHEEGFFHIHDLTAGLVGYCAGWSLENLLLYGFGNVEHQMDSKPAKHLDTAILHIINFLRCTYNEFAGAQAFSSLDTYLAPFVRYDGLGYQEVKQEMQRLVFSLNVPSRWGFEMPFTNFTFDIKPPTDLAKKPVIIGGKQQRQTYGQFQKEMEMINKAFLEVMLEGDDLGRIFTFPIPTYNLTKDFDWESDVAKLLFKVTARFGIPYFQNYIGSNLDPNSIRAMCCRLNLNLKALMNQPGSLWGKGDSTGSIGVVTINLNRLAYLAAKDGHAAARDRFLASSLRDTKRGSSHKVKGPNTHIAKNDHFASAAKGKFFKLLSHYMDLAKESLEIKRDLVTKNLQNGLMPYAKAYLGTFRNYFSTIGVCGGNEACLNFLGKDITSPEGIEFISQTLEFARNRLVDYQKETGHLYNLEATPAESTAYRLALLDRKLHKDIITAGTPDTPYLTNSTQLPVSKTDDVIEAILHQNKIQPLYSGGTVFHTFLGEEIDDWRTCRELVKKIATNTKLPYFTITPTFSICAKHGRLKGKHFTCPKCGKATEVYSRIVGYFRSVRLWNKGKRQEFDDRQTFNPETGLNGRWQKKTIRHAEFISASRS
jgi:anaerobic ribonucleoside-triphosphate reductase